MEWKAIPCSWFGRLDIIKMAVLPKAIYRFTVIATKILAASFAEMEKLILKSSWNCKEL